MECAAAYDLLPSGGVATPHPHRRLEKHLKNRERQALLLSSLCFSLASRRSNHFCVSCVPWPLLPWTKSSFFFIKLGAVSLPVVQEPAGFIQSV
jgi:hypothetical protein